MKCLWKLVISFVIFLTLCLSHVKAATSEQLETIFLRLYTGSDIETYVDAYLEEAVLLIENMDVEKRTVLYIHGFTENVNKTSVHTIINAYLTREDHNVLALDWSELAGDNYLKVSSNVESVGKAVADALNDMVYTGLPWKNIHIVGHSMGAHVSAYVGRNVDFPLQRITGLDPAGPLYTIVGKHLTKTDAKFVDIIHTDAGVYGIIRITGSVDFFPNGGRRVQPGCPHAYSFMSSEDFCSHHRSWVFYAESLIKENSFIAVRCIDQNGFPARKKRDSSHIAMGYATPTDSKGSYCLVTGSKSNYGLGMKGARNT